MWPRKRPPMSLKVSLYLYLAAFGKRIYRTIKLVYYVAKLIKRLQRHHRKFLHARVLNDTLIRVVWLTSHKMVLRSLCGSIPWRTLLGYWSYHGLLFRKFSCQLRWELWLWHYFCSLRFHKWYNFEVVFAHISVYVVHFLIICLQASNSF